MKRQRGRGRKPGGGGGGGGNNHNHGNRSLESSGPDVKIRGTAAQIYEKYSQYARDAQSGGDRVKYESFLQHAEHYYRVMAATMPRERLLAQQNGEGGMQQPQHTGEGNQAQSSEGGMQGGETQDALKVMDDHGSDADDGDDEVEVDAGGDEGGERDEVEASGGQQDAQQGNAEGSGRGRRRRGRRRPNDGERSGGQGGDTEARSALDSLARKQGALTGG